MSRYAGNDDTCPVCQLRYGDFRAAPPMTFADAAEIRMALSKEAAASGDYSKPLTKSSALGIMHAHKQECWAAHLEWCDEWSQHDDFQPVTEQEYDMTKTAKLTKGTTNIFTPEGTVSIPAEVFGAFAVHKTYRGTDKDTGEVAYGTTFQVTHAPSGLRVMDEGNNKGWAVGLVQRIANAGLAEWGKDWDGKSDANRPDTEALAAEVNAYKLLYLQHGPKGKPTAAMLKPDVVVEDTVEPTTTVTEPAPELEPARSEDEAADFAKVVGKWLRSLLKQYKNPKLDEATRRAGVIVDSLLDPPALSPGMLRVVARCLRREFARVGRGKGYLLTDEQRAAFVKWANSAFAIAGIDALLRDEDEAKNAARLANEAKLAARKAA